MTGRILTTLALLALTLAVSVGLLHAQGSTESERPPYRIDLLLGWNLISFPGDPADPALENVMGDSKVDIVLAYREGQWEAAVRTSDGRWRATSGFTVMSGGQGYWMHAFANDAIETAFLADSAKPAIEGCEWQLVGVWDAEQRPAGTEVDADDYFAQAWWRVAYGFLTDENLWTKRIPRSGGTVETGAGYWVWTSCPSSCPPVSETLVLRGAEATVEVNAGYRMSTMGSPALSCP